MISNYNLDCGYHNFELKDKIYLVPDWALKVIYTDGFNEVVFQGDSSNVTLLEGHEITFQEEASFDERFKFSKTLSIKVNGYKTFNDLDYRYYAIIETKDSEFYLVNSDFPSFVTHTYTLNASTNETELVFSSQSNIATLKLTNFEPNNVNTCNEYSTPKVKKFKLTESWASSLSTWQKSLINKGTFSDIEPLQDSISLTEEFDGEKYTVTLGFDIPMSHFKNDWHIKLLQFEENKYRGYISLEDGNKAFVGYNVGLFPSYTINGDIISIRLTETAIRGIAYGDDYAIIDTNMPNSIEFLGATCKNYNFESSCDWEVESKPNYITIAPMSGNADTQYTLQVCNTDDETGYAVSEFIIKTCNARVRPEVIIKNPIYRYTATTETVCTEVTNERWIESGTTCVGVDKYSRDIEQVSYDSAQNWYNTGNESATTLIEANSPDCGYAERLMELESKCAYKDKYTQVLSQITFDSGETWQIQDVTTVVEENSPECGYNYFSGLYKLSSEVDLSGTIEVLDYGYCTSTNTIVNYRGGTSPYTGSCDTIEIGRCATGIGFSAFNDFRRVSRLVIGPNINSIDGKAFFDCYSLTSLTIPSGVTYIGLGAFKDCHSLKSIICKPVVPPTLSESASAFEQTNDCPIYVPCESVNAYKSANGWNRYADRIRCIVSGTLPIVDGKYKFTLNDTSTVSGECDSTSSITRSETSAYTTTIMVAEVGNCTTFIEQASFSGCTNLKSVIIPDNVTSIGTSAFTSCPNLTLCTIPNSVTSIGNSAFTSCLRLAAITLSNNLTSISNGIFKDCGKLLSIDIPNSVTSIGDSAFSNCSGLTTCTIGSGVTSIGDSAFYLCRRLKSISIPNSVTTIGNGAFDGCRGISSCTIGNSVTTIGASAFTSCRRIKRIVIPNSVTSIGNKAFYGCASLSSVTIPNNITEIKTQTFQGCNSLTSIAIPSGVTSIGIMAFFACSGLTSLDIPESVKYIDRQAFQGCNSLTSITLNRVGPPILGKDALYHTNGCPIYVPCASVDAYKSATNWSTYADRIQGIPPCGQPTFEEKYKLTLSNSSTVSAECDSTSAVTESEVSTPYKSTLVSAEIGDCVTFIGAYAFNECSRLTSIDIPNSVTSIGYGAFWACGLTSIDIPNSVKTIGDKAFTWSSRLTSVDIPSGVTSIGDSAFEQCYNLTSVTVNATTPPTLGVFAFRATNSCPIYVPSGSVNVYKAASGWSNYASRIQAKP